MWLKIIAQVVCLVLFIGSLVAVDMRPDERLSLEAFDRELKAQTAAAAFGKAPTDHARLRQAAKERRVIMKRLVREDPEQAVALALDRARRKQVPAEIQDELEQEISTMGELQVRISRPVDEQDAPEVKREALVQGKRYQVTTWGSGLEDHSAGRRSLHGVVVDGVLALIPGRLRVLKPGEPIAPGKRLDDQRCSVSGKLAGENQEPDDGLEDVIVESGDAVYVLCQGGHIAQLGDQIQVAEEGSTKLASSWTSGPKKVLYLIARCSNETSFPQTVASANSVMTSVANFFNSASWGQTTMTWEIVQIVLPKTTSQYSGTTDGDILLLYDARAAVAAIDAKYAWANWHFDIVRHSKLFGSWSGQGYVGGKGTWLQSSSVGTAIHELGHNYGLKHANFWNTGESSVIGAGSNVEYGDPFSEMGGSGQFSAYEKWRLDWIAAANVQTITTSGTYRVHASDLATPPTGSAMFGLRITKDSQRDYWISHRRQFNNAWNLQGVHLHWDPWSITGTGDSKGGTHLLDTTPGSANGKNDTALVRGRTFSDFADNIHITPMTLNTGTNPVSIDVVVNLGAFPDNKKPTVNVTASATSVATGASVTFNATASDPDGDALAVYWDFSDTKAPMFASNTLTTTKSWSAAKDYPVRVTVSDMKGGTASATVVVRVGTVSTYRISGRVRTSADVGIEGVRVHRGNTASSVWTNSDGSYTLVNIPAGTKANVQAKSDGAVYTRNFTNPVTVGPDATGRNFTRVDKAPTVQTAAAASPAIVSGKTSMLSVLGADDGGEAFLTYTWEIIGTPPAPVTFSHNGTNAAKSTLATFDEPGSYPCRVTIRDLTGLTVTSTVTVTVNQAVTIVVTPKNPTVNVGATQAFSASAMNQFGIAIVPQPTFTWSVSGGKTISAEGVLAASDTAGGPYLLTVTGGGGSASTTFTVVDDTVVSGRPTISAIADVETATDTSTEEIAFTVADQDTAADLLTVTKASSDVTVVPTDNIILGGRGSNRTVTITPAARKTGIVTITLTVTDAQGLTASETFIVYVGVQQPTRDGGAGGGGGSCGLGAGASAFLALFALMLQRLHIRRRRSFTSD